jgi:hypothetical protein
MKCHPEPLISRADMRRIFGPKRDEMVGGWRKLHNEERHNLYSSPNITTMLKAKEDEMGRKCSTYGGKEDCIYDFHGEVRRK